MNFNITANRSEVLHNSFILCWVLVMAMLIGCNSRATVERLKGSGVSVSVLSLDSVHVGPRKFGSTLWFSIKNCLPENGCQVRRFRAGEGFINVIDERLNLSLSTAPVGTQIRMEHSGVHGKIGIVTIPRGLREPFQFGIVLRLNDAIVHERKVQMKPAKAMVPESISGSDESLGIVFKCEPASDRVYVDPDSCAGFFELQNKGKASRGVWLDDFLVFVGADGVVISQESFVRVQGTVPAGDTFKSEHSFRIPEKAVTAKYHSLRGGTPLVLTISRQEKDLNVYEIAE